jgi:RsiW-degrading membrane proteinase PrsW (M82 family)
LEGPASITTGGKTSASVAWGAPTYFHLLATFYEFHFLDCLILTPLSSLNSHMVWHSSWPLFSLLFFVYGLLIIAFIILNIQSLI